MKGIKIRKNTLCLQVIWSYKENILWNIRTDQWTWQGHSVKGQFTKINCMNYIWKLKFNKFTVASKTKHLGVKLNKVVQKRCLAL